MQTRQKVVREDRETFEFAFITYFNSNYKKEEGILNRYCPIILKDGIPGPLLLKKSRIMYRKVSLLGLNLAPNVINSPEWKLLSG